MEPTQESLTHLANQLQTEFDKSIDRATEWRARTKTKIENALRALHSLKTNLKWFVQPNIVDGQEFVAFQLQPAPTVNNPQQSRKGGTLTYNLTHRGKVLPVIIYPYVEGQIGQRPPFIIGGESIEPEAITRELIWSHVQTFLEEIIRWETGNSIPVGFKMEGDKLSFSDEPKLEGRFLET